MFNYTDETSTIGYYSESVGDNVELDIFPESYEDEVYSIDNDPESEVDTSVIVLGIASVMGMIGVTHALTDSAVEAYRIDKEIELKRELIASKQREKRRLERICFCKRHWRGLHIFALAITLILMVIGVTIEYRKGIKIGITSDCIIGMNYEEAALLLEKNGFTNIVLYPEVDLDIKNIAQENKVSNVLIGRRVSFDEFSVFPYDARIKLIYHVIKDMPVPISSKNGKRLNYIELVDELEESGFVNIEIEPEYDLITGWIIKEGTVEEYTIDGQAKFKEGDEYRPDARIFIRYHAKK